MRWRTKVLSEEIGHDGVSLIGVRALAGKEAQPTEKTEARDLPQNIPVFTKYLRDMLHETQKKPAPRLK